MLASHFPLPAVPPQTYSQVSEELEEQAGWGESNAKTGASSCITSNPTWEKAASLLIFTSKARKGWNCLKPGYTWKWGCRLEQAQGCHKGDCAMYQQIPDWVVRTDFWKLLTLFLANKRGKRGSSSLQLSPGWLSLHFWGFDVGMPELERVRNKCVRVLAGTPVIRYCK